MNRQMGKTLEKEEKEREEARVCCVCAWMFECVFVGFLDRGLLCS